MNKLAKLLLAPLMLLPFALVGIAPAAGAATPARWQLEDYHQRSCFDTNVHDTYYGVYVQGTWRHAIAVGADDLPAGATFDTSYAPIPPGSSGGEYTLAYVHVTLPSGTALGRYSARLWASDGTTQSWVPVGMNVRSSCGY